MTPPDEPVADFGIDPKKPTTEDDVRLYDFSFDPAGVGIASRWWEFGDGGGSQTAAPRHRFAPAGIYTVRLAVRTFDGRESSVVRKIHIRTRRHPPRDNRGL